MNIQKLTSESNYTLQATHENIGSLHLHMATLAQILNDPYFQQKDNSYLFSKNGLRVSVFHLLPSVATITIPVGKVISQRRINQAAIKGHKVKPGI